MENLPPALQDFIKLRVTYPDATLKELGERANPPLSKSAVYHRVRRIEQMGEGGARLGGFSRRTETLGAGCASSRAAPGRTS